MAEATRKEIRRFGFILGGLFCVFAGFSWWRDGWIPWPYLIAPGALLLLMALFNVPILRSVFKGWMAFAHVLAWFNTRLILGLLYYVVMTPLGFVMRVFGHDPLRKRRRPAPSYWDLREETPVDPERYRKQY